MIGELLAPPVRADTLAAPSLAMRDAFGVRSTAAGIAVNENTAANISTVFCAAELISNALGIMPLDLFKRTGPNSKELARDHPAYRMASMKPNERQSCYQFFKFMQSGKIFWGNGFAEIQRNGRGVPLSMNPIHPSRVGAKLIGDKEELVWLVRNNDGTETTVPDIDMLHPMWHTRDGFVGLSVIRLARESLGLALAAEAFGARFFGNSARPSGVLTTPNSMKPELVEQNRARWKQMHGGERQGETALLTGGIEFKPISMPNNDAQFLETRQFSVIEIARWFNVPPHMLKDLSNAAYNAGIEHQRIEFVSDCILPHATDFEQECDRKLLSEADRDAG